MSVRPYTIPHGEERAGLRDYLPAFSDCRRPDRHDDEIVVWVLVTAVLFFILGLLFGTGVKVYAAEPTVKFIQPRAAFVLAPPTGTDVPVQIRIERDAANRGYAITWCTGAHAHALDGAADAAVQPDARPLSVHLPPGDCEFVASVFGPGGTLRGRASFVMHVCGGQDDCAPQHP